MADNYANLFVVGAPKTGTTSLYDYFSEHPDIFIPSKKELHFFSHPDITVATRGPGDAFSVAPTVHTEREYVSFFENAYDHATIAVDVSPSYLYFTNSFSRILAAQPDARFVVVLRDPVERAYSQYLHLRRAGRETLSFEDALAAEANRVDKNWAVMWRYVDSNMYSRSIQTLFAIAGRDRVLVIHNEDLRADHNAVLDRIYNFCGLAAHEATGTVERNVGGLARSQTIAKLANNPSVLRKVFKRLMPQALRTKLALKVVELNTTGTTEPMKAETRAHLEQVFAPEAARLQRLLGKSLPWKWVPNSNDQH